MVYTVTYYRGLTQFVNFLLAGEAPREWAPFLSGARLIPFVKAPSGVRPIAIGDTLRRLASKCANKSIAEDVAKFLSPLQLGVGIPNAIEAISRAVLAVRGLHGLEDDYTEVSVDLLNAFNLVERDTMLSLVRIHNPSIYAWVSWCYSSASNLFYRDDLTLQSRCGAQQGDNLGPYLFSLVLQPILSRLKRSFPGLYLNVWYLDDGKLIGKKSDVEAALQLLFRLGAHDGIVPGNKTRANRDLVVYKPGADSQAMDIDENPLIPIIVEPFGKHLGVPDEPCLEKFFDDRLSKCDRFFQALHQIDRHDAMKLLSLCGATCRMVFFARNIAPALAQPYFSRFDKRVGETFTELTGVPWLGTYSMQAQLWSIGFGLRSIERHSSAAYLAASSACNNLVSLLLNIESFVDPVVVSAARRFNDLVKPEGRVTLPITSVLKQRILSEHIDERMEEVLFQCCSRESQVRLRQQKEREAMAFFRLHPNSRFGLKFSNDETAMVVQQWLGYDHLADAKCRACKNGDYTLGRLYAHGVTCHSEYHRIARHNSVRNEVRNLFSMAGHVVHSREGRLPETSYRPGDIAVERFQGGRDAFLDVRVGSPIQQQYLARGVTEAHVMHLAAEDEKSKKNGVKQKCDDAGIDFIPLILSTYGVWSTQARSLFRGLAQRVADFDGKNAKGVLSRFYERASFILMRWNARMVLDRRPAPQGNDTVRRSYGVLP